MYHFCLSSCFRVVLFEIARGHHRRVRIASEWPRHLNAPFKCYLLRCYVDHLYEDMIEDTGLEKVVKVHLPVHESSGACFSASRSRLSRCDLHTRLSHCTPPFCTLILCLFVGPLSDGRCAVLRVLTIIVGLFILRVLSHFAESELELDIIPCPEMCQTNECLVVNRRCIPSTLHLQYNHMSMRILKYFLRPDQRALRVERP